MVNKVALTDKVYEKVLILLEDNGIIENLDGRKLSKFNRNLKSAIRSGLD